MSDSNDDCVQRWITPPSSTLSAEALPFIPKGFVPIVSPAGSEGPSCGHAVEVPGYYSSLVPTPTPPFYAMHYGGAHQLQIITFSDNEALSIPSSKIHGSISTTGCIHQPSDTSQCVKGSSSRNVATSQQRAVLTGKGSRLRRQPARDSKIDHPNPGKNSNRRESVQSVMSVTGINPDLSNKAEFPCLSSSALEADMKTSATGMHVTSVSYSTALKLQPCSTTRPGTTANCLAKVCTAAKSVDGGKTKSWLSSEDSGFGSSNCEELKGDRSKRKQKGSCAKGTASFITAENGRKQENNVHNSEREVQKMLDGEVTASSKRMSVKVGRVGLDAAKKLQGIEYRSIHRQRFCNRVQPAVVSPSVISTDQNIEQHILKNEISSYDISEVPRVLSAAVKKLEGGHSYAAVLSSAARASKEQPEPEKAGTGISKDSKVTAHLALHHSFLQERSTITPNAQNTMSRPNSALPQCWSGPNQDNCAEKKQDAACGQGSSRSSNQVRVNVSKVKKETHNSALMRNILRSQQRVLMGKKESPKEPARRNTKKKHRKKALQIPDLMEDKVGVISQELLDFLKGSSGRKGVAVSPQSTNVQCCQVATGDKLLEYPPLEERDTRQENVTRRICSPECPVLSTDVNHQALLGSYGKIVPAMAVGETISQSVSPVKPKQQSSAEGKVQSRGLLKLVALRSDSVPKHKESINMKLGSIILPKMKQSTKKKDKNILTGTMKKEFTKVLTNVLDSSAPLKKRGKERELPPKKKLSVMKKIIVKEREQRKQLLEKMRQAATLRQQKVDTCAPLKEGITKVSMDAEGCSSSKQQEGLNYRLHSRNFREYCDHLISKEINEATQKLIGDLVFFQDRLHAKDPIKAKAKRRLVYGMKEVRKYLGLNKLKCVIFAPDIEEVKAEGGLDDSLHDLIDCATRQSVPVVFAMRRRALGRCSKKRVPISCIGIFDYSGREDDYKHLLSLVTEARNAYNYTAAHLNEEGSNETARGITELTFTDVACEDRHRCTELKSSHQTMSYDHIYMTEKLKLNHHNTAHEVWKKDDWNYALLDDGWVTTNEDD